MRIWSALPLIALLVVAAPRTAAWAADTDTDTDVDTDTGDDADTSDTSDDGGSSSSDDSDLPECGDTDTDLQACYPTGSNSQRGAAELAGDPGGCTCAGDRSSGGVVALGLLLMAGTRRRR